MTSSPRLSVVAETWPIAGAFRIARGAKTEAHVLVVTLEADGKIGRGEAVPYARYGETMEESLAAVRAMADAISGGLDRQGLMAQMAPGAARNAIDCALFDLEAKQAGVRAWTLVGLADVRPLKTCYTLSLDTPEKMGEAAAAAARRPMLKLKIGGPDGETGGGARRRAEDAPRRRRQ
jgi:L-alanine-DL-glutamate epimerase-like enolase superfamily enzyme